MNTEDIAITFTEETPADDRERLLLALETVVETKPVKQRSGLELAAIILLVKQIGTVAGTLTAFSKLAREIKTWREELSKRGKDVNATLKSNGRPPLELKTATFETIEQWLVNSKQ